MTWHEALAWLLLGAALALAAWGWLRRPAPTQALPAPPRPPDVPGEAEAARREEEARQAAQQVAADPDPGKTASDIMRRKP